MNNSKTSGILNNKNGTKKCKKRIVSFSQDTKFELKDTRRKINPIKNIEDDTYANETSNSDSFENSSDAEDDRNAFYSSTSYKVSNGIEDNSNKSDDSDSYDAENHTFYNSDSYETENNNIKNKILDNSKKYINDKYNSTIQEEQYRDQNNTTKYEETNISLFNKKYDEEKENAEYVYKQAKLWNQSYQSCLQQRYPCVLMQMLPTPTQQLQQIPDLKNENNQNLIENLLYRKLCIASGIVAQSLDDNIHLERTIINTTIPYNPPKQFEGLTAKKRYRYIHDTIETNTNKNKKLKIDDIIDNDLKYMENYLSSTWDKNSITYSTILDDWYYRYNTINANDNKIDDTPISKQISITLSSSDTMERQIARTRLRRLCQHSIVDTIITKDNDDLSQFDDNIFDDTDFFSSISHSTYSIYDDTIISSSSNNLISNTTAITKEKKVSKSKKIPMEPFPKLIKFMSPIMTSEWVAFCTSNQHTTVTDLRETLADELVKNLFNKDTIVKG